MFRLHARLKVVVVAIRGVIWCYREGHWQERPSFQLFLARQTVWAGTWLSGNPCLPKGVRYYFRCKKVLVKESIKDYEQLEFFNVLWPCFCAKNLFSVQEMLRKCLGNDVNILVFLVSGQWVTWNIILNIIITTYITMVKI